ncbi:hypothetical protein TRVA0_103S00100 [Trichomonascus vanleenenianus]|uniref:mitotic-spindle organizing protein 1 n=1 Tax=Trichomonascus vanleenenianus TaxID=2268995 RepID=UPI003EC9568D
MDSREKSREAVNVIYEISQLLNTELDKQTTALCISLCERGVSPETLATVIQQLRKESKKLT